MATNPIDAKLASLRAQLANALGEDFGTDAAQALKTALQSTKKARVQRHCTKCSCNHIEYVEVPDSPNAVAAIKLAVEQLEGRPGVAEEQEHDKITITRHIGTPTDTETAAQLLTEAGWLLTAPEAPEGHAMSAGVTHTRDVDA